MRVLIPSLALFMFLSAPSSAPGAQPTVRAVMHSDLKVLDPIWTPATITRLHAYMIYDTLFAMDTAPGASLWLCGRQGGQS